MKDEVSCKPRYRVEVSGIAHLRIGSGISFLLPSQKSSSVVKLTSHLLQKEHQFPKLPDFIPPDASTANQASKRTVPAVYNTIAGKVRCIRDETPATATADSSRSACVNIDNNQTVFVMSLFFYTSLEPVATGRLHDARTPREIEVETRYVQDCRVW
jgi:hypothetical protein